MNTRCCIFKSAEVEKEPLRLLNYLIKGNVDELEKALENARKSKKKDVILNNMKEYDLHPEACVKIVTNIKGIDISKIDTKVLNGFFKERSKSPWARSVHKHDIFSFQPYESLTQKNQDIKNMEGVITDYTNKCLPQDCPYIFFIHADKKDPTKVNQGRIDGHICYLNFDIHTGKTIGRDITQLFEVQTFGWTKHASPGAGIYDEQRSSVPKPRALAVTQMIDELEKAYRAGLDRIDRLTPASKLYEMHRSQGVYLDKDDLGRRYAIVRAQRVSIDSINSDLRRRGVEIGIGQNLEDISLQQTRRNPLDIDNYHQRRCNHKTLEDFNRVFGENEPVFDASITKKIMSNTLNDDERWNLKRKININYKRRFLYGQETCVSPDDPIAHACWDADTVWHDATGVSKAFAEASLDVGTKMLGMVADRAPKANETPLEKERRLAENGRRALLRPSLEKQVAKIKEDIAAFDLTKTLGNSDYAVKEASAPVEAVVVAKTLDPIVPIITKPQGRILSTSEFRDLTKDAHRLASIRKDMPRTWGEAQHHVWSSRVETFKAKWGIIGNAGDDAIVSLVTVRGHVEKLKDDKLQTWVTYANDWASKWLPNKEITM